MLKIILPTLLLPLTLLANIDNIFPFQTIQKANRAYGLGDYNRSIELFNSLEKDDPSVDYNRANAEYKAGDYESALLSYAKAKGVDEATRLYNIGNIYFKKKEWGRAIESYEASLVVREDDDTRFNLELAKRKKEEKKRKEQEEKSKKDKDKKKEDEEKRKKEEEKKKQEEEKKNRDKKEQDKKDKQKQDKKKGQDKESDKRKKSNKDNAQDGKKKEKKDKMTQEEKLTQKELKRLMKKLNDKKMPTMMYQASPENRGDRDDKNPW